MTFMQRAWNDNALAGFRRTDVIWLEFLEQHESEQRDLYLTVMESRAAIRLVLEFIVYLEDNMGFTGAQIGRTLTNLRAIIAIRGGLVAVFSSECVGIARRAVRKHSSMFSGTIDVEHEPNKPKVQLPVCVEFMSRFREMYWHPGSNLDQKMTYIASMVAFLRGLRISNVAATGSKPGARDHRYRMKSVEVEVSTGFLSASEWKKDGGTQDVISVKLECVSSKTHGPTHPTKKTVAPIVMIAGVGSAHEQLLMADLLTWIRLSGMMSDEDLLFARTAVVVRRKVTKLKRDLQSKDVSTAIKRVSESFNMDPARFSTRSLRIGANVELSAQGVTDGQRMNCLDHVSLDSNIRYLRAMQHDPNPLSEGGRLSIDNVRKMARFM